MKLTKNYKPRIVFNTDFGIGDSENSTYLNSITNWQMARINRNAKPYHKKHIGVSDNGNTDKEVIITKEELKQKFIDSNGFDPNGVELYFGPIAYLNNPTRAIALGLMTKDQNSRKPSADRIVSDIKVYSNKNTQITTKRFNLGKGSDDSYSSVTQNVKVKVLRGVELTIDKCSPQFLAEYTQSLAA